MLQGEQLPIMRAWLALLKRPINGSYKTDTGLWLCDCGTQKYHSYLLCKHLVQDLPLPSPDWWASVVRRHTPPFYDIRELLPEDKRATAPIPAALGPRYWTGQYAAPSQRPMPLITGPQVLVCGTHSPYAMTELFSGHISSKGS